MSLAGSRAADHSLRVILLLLAIALSGCAGRAWEQALDENSAATYHRFLDEYAQSEYAELAKERIAFLKLERDPTIEHYDRFRREFPDSKLADGLLQEIEQPAFEAALARGTADAYREFIAGFTRGAYAARAAGNAVYVEAEGFRGDPGQLASFARNYRASDFAAEAARTATAVAAVRSRQIDRVELVVRVADTSPEAERVRQALTERTLELAKGLGLTVLHPNPTRGPAQAGAQSIAQLELRHDQRTVEGPANRGSVARPSIVAATDVSLVVGGEGVVHRRFELRVDQKAHVPGMSLLFSREAAPYWREFFIPVARWENHQAIRPPVALNRSVVDVAAAGDRAVVLYEDGDVELIGLADPMSPFRLAQYERGEDHLKWTGIQLLGDRIVIFGEEGLEIIRFTARGPVAELRLVRGEIGRVHALTPVADQLVTVGAKGVQVVNPRTGEVRRVMYRAMKSVAALGRTLVLADGETIYVSTLELLARNRVVAQTRLGRVFGPDHVRIFDRTAVVTGAGGALMIDVGNPEKPRAIAQHSSRKIGRVEDVARVGGRTFLVGERGLQVLNRRLDRVEEFVDVGDRRRLTVMGRHLVAADGASIQVVDATPWVDSSRPASVSP